jgi:hypothetical protein
MQISMSLINNTNNLNTALVHVYSEILSFGDLYTVAIQWPKCFYEFLQMWPCKYISWFSKFLYYIHSTLGRDSLNTSLLYQYLYYAKIPWRPNINVDMEHIGSHPNTNNSLLLKRFLPYRMGGWTDFYYILLIWEALKKDFDMRLKVIYNSQGNQKKRERRTVHI